MRWRSVLAAVVLLVLTGPGSAQTARDALKLVPGDALGFVVVNRLADTSGQVAELAAQFGTRLPASPLEMLKAQLGIQKSLNEKGSVVFAVLPPAKEGTAPVPLVCIPVTDGKQFLRELKAKNADAELAEVEIKDQTLVIARKGSFAIVAPAEYRESLKKALNTKAVAATSAASVLPWVEEQTVAGVLMPGGVKLVSEQVLKGLEVAKGFVPGADSAEGKAALAYFEWLEGALKSLRSDMTSFALGLRQDKAGNLHLAKRAAFARGSSLAKAGSGITPLPGSPFAGLSARPFALAFGGPYPEESAQKLMGFGLQMMKALLKDAPAEKLKKLDQAYANMNKGIQGMAVVVSPPDKGKPLFSGTVVVMKVKDATGYLERYEKGIKDVREVFKDTKIAFGTPSATRRLKVDGLAALEATTDLSAGKEAFPEGTKKLLEAMYGKSGKMRITLVAVAKDTILMPYVAAAESEGIVKAYRKGGKTTLPGVVKVSGLLPRGSQWIGYISLSGVMDLVRQAASLEGQAEKIPQFPKTPPIGFAVKAGGGVVEGHLVMPAETLRALGQLVKQLRRVEL
jgi:hypothetical protein